MEKPILDDQTLLAVYKKEAAVRASCDNILEVLFMVGKEKLFRPETADLSTTGLKNDLETVAAHFAPGKTLAEIAAIVIATREIIASLKKSSC